jgi:hypothetical protein
MQPAMATMTPNTAALTRPTAKSVKSKAACVSRIYSMGEMPKRPIETSAPPSIPTTSAYRHKSGIMRIRASMRGNTRNSMGETPSVLKASISLLTCIVPSCAANAAPVRPAMMIPVIMAPISRAMPIPTRSAM